MIFGSVWRFIAGGGSCHAAAEHFSIGVSTAIRIAARVKARGTLAPLRQGRPPGRGKLAPYTGFLIELVEAVPDITLEEMATALEEQGVKVHPSSISRVLTKAGMSYKKSRSTPRSASVRTCAPGVATGWRSASRACARSPSG